MSENLIDEVNAISIKSHETNALQTWNYEDKQIRTIKMDGEMWFFAKDVAQILGYAKPMLTKKIKRIPRFKATLAELR